MNQAFSEISEQYVADMDAKMNSLKPNESEERYEPEEIFNGVFIWVFIGASITTVFTISLAVAGWI